MTRKSLFFLPLIFALAACHGSGGASPETLDNKLKSGKELAELGDVEVHEGYVELIGRINPNVEAQLKTPAGKKRLVDSLLEQEILYKESIRRGIPALPEVQEKAALYQRVIFGQALIDEEINKKATEYYGQNKDKEFSRVKVAHILIRPTPPTPQKPEKGAKTPPDNAANDAAALKKAQEAKAKLSSGSPWADVVMEYSMDIATKSKGGELGYLTRTDRRGTRLDWNELIDKAFTMKVGEISDPIKAKDGYHIITLQEEATIAPFEEVQNTIKFKLRTQVKNEILTGLTKGAKTEYKDQEIIALEAQPSIPSFGLPGSPEGVGPQAASPSPGTKLTAPPPKPNQPPMGAPEAKPAAPEPAPPAQVEKKEEKKVEQAPAPKY